MSKLVTPDGKEVVIQSKYKCILKNTVTEEEYIIITPLNTERLLWNIREKINEIYKLDKDEAVSQSELTEKTKDLYLDVMVDPPIELPDSAKIPLKAQITDQVTKELNNSSETATPEEIEARVTKEMETWVAAQNKPFSGKFIPVIEAISRTIVIPSTIPQHIHHMFNSLMHSSSIVYAHVAIGMKIPGTDNIITTGLAFINNYLEPTVDNAKEFKEETTKKMEEYWAELVAPDIIK